MGWDALSKPWPPGSSPTGPHHQKLLVTHLLVGLQGPPPFPSSSLQRRDGFLHVDCTCLWHPPCGPTPSCARASAELPRALPAPAPGQQDAVQGHQQTSCSSRPRVLLLKHLSPLSPCSVFYLYVLWMRNCTCSCVGTCLELPRQPRGCRTAAMKLGWSSGSSTWGSSFGAFLKLVTLKGVGLSESSPRALATSMEGHPHELLLSWAAEPEKKDKASSMAAGLSLHMLTPTPCFSAVILLQQNYFSQSGLC